jgi:hypothetical protein
MERRRSQPHPLELEQWLLAEQTAAQRARTESRLDLHERADLVNEDAALRQRLLESCPPEQLARRVRARLAAEPRLARRGSQQRQRYRLAALLVTACAALALWRTPSDHEVGRVAEERGSDELGERAKGVGLELRVFRQQGAVVERLEPGARVAAHQVLQLGYARAGFTHGVLLSIDGRGGVTLHAPREQGDSTALSARNEQLLSEAYELDDAPGFERFILVVSRQPLSVEQVLGAARSLAQDIDQARTAKLPLTLPNEQRSVLVWKSVP